MEAEAPEYLKLILTPEEAIQKLDESSLLVVVDNHKPSYTEAPELLELTDKIVLIDHHRRGAEFIEDPILTYLEPYASSTCELVTEILYYMSDKMEISRFEADALLAGITVDTKKILLSKLELGLLRLHQYLREQVQIPQVFANYSEMISIHFYIRQK